MRISNVRVSNLPRRARGEDNLAGAIAKFLLATTVLGVLFAGLFPFDFSLPRGVSFVDKIRNDFDRSPEAPLLEDRVVNIVFFVPLGLCVAAVVRAQNNRAAWQIVTATIAGAGLSLIVEVGQVFLGFRDPTWSDVEMNTIGAAAGATTFAFAGGDRALREIARQFARVLPFVHARSLAIVTVLFGLCIVLLPLLVRDRGKLHNWDSAYPLMLGNELTRERPWRGTVGAWRCRPARSTSRTSCAWRIRRVPFSAIR